MFELSNGTKISKKMIISFECFFSKIGEKHPNAHGPTASPITTAFYSVKMIVFYSKW